MKCVREAVWGPGETPDSAYQVGAGMAEQVISPQAAAGEDRTSHKVDKKKKGYRRSKRDPLEGFITQCGYFQNWDLQSADAISSFTIITMTLKVISLLLSISWIDPCPCQTVIAGAVTSCDDFINFSLFC